MDLAPLCSCGCSSPSFRPRRVDKGQGLPGIQCLWQEVGHCSVVGRNTENTFAQKSMLSKWDQDSTTYRLPVENAGLACENDRGDDAKPSRHEADFLTFCKRYLNTSSDENKKELFAIDTLRDRIQIRAAIDEV